ncbi:MAG: TetR/AcrR family transcriptional regulator [Chloroflexota bacterium]
MTKTSARQLILEAVATCIEKYGIDKLTTRKIAEEAGTNVASINYYFRSKDELVAEALMMTIRHMMEDVFVAIDEQDSPFQAVLEDVFFYLIDGATRFPGISTAHLYAAVVEKRYDSPGALAIVRVFERLVEGAMAEYPGKDPGQIRFLLSQVISAIMFAMLAPGFFPLPEKVQPLDEERCRAIAKSYAKTFFSAM